MHIYQPMTVCSAEGMHFSAFIIIVNSLSLSPSLPLSLSPSLPLSLSFCSRNGSEMNITMSKKGKKQHKYVRPLINSFEGELPTIATPTKVLTDCGGGTFSASQLTINEKTKVGQTDHFQTTPIPQDLWKTLKCNLTQYQEAVLYCHPLEKHVSSLFLRHRFNMCKTKIQEELLLLRDNWPMREMELRYAVVDPLMEMIGDIWTLKVRCEYCYCNVINPRACAEGYGSRFVWL